MTVLSIVILLILVTPILIHDAITFNQEDKQ